MVDARRSAGKAFPGQGAALLTPNRAAHPLSNGMKLKLEFAALLLSTLVFLAWSIEQIVAFLTLA
tara:strand:- start:238 stop:432 length:195 start_codon:yes stop_codon:yes gene_type:complete